MAGKVLLVCLLAAVGVGVNADLKVMTDVTLGFGQALEHCRVETGLTEEKMEEFFHFWSEDFDFNQRELGCALRCMGNYFNLITDANKLHHANTEKFVKNFPNGEVLAVQLVEIIHECEKQAQHEEDQCLRLLLIAKCFRDTCRSRNLAPTMEMLLAEFIMQAEQ